MTNYLRSCLHCDIADTNMSTVPTKRLYRIYGLLLSACSMKNEPISTHYTMQMSVVTKVSFRFQHIKYITKIFYYIGTEKLL